jgi:putative tricarboxylic transport membrane protein
MLIFGIVGLALEYARFPLAPFVVGFVLGPLAEAKLRTALMTSAGSMLPLVQRPIALGLTLVAVTTCLWPLLRLLRRR